MNFANLINIQAIITSIVANAPRLLAAVIIMSIFIALYKLFKRPLESICKNLQLEAPIIQLVVHSIFKWTLYIFGGLMAAKQVGVDVGAVLAGLGVAGIAIGFAAQDTISNIIAGFIIFLDRPFTVGDWIKTGDHYGKVHEITMRSTRIRTEGNTYIIIPNKAIIDEVVDNHSKYGHLRIEIPISIAYKESIDTARSVLLEAVSTLPTVLRDPPPEVVVTELGDSGVHLDVEVWVDEAEQEEPTRDEVTEMCKKALDAAGIQIPFPHMQLLVDNTGNEATSKL